MDSKWTKQDKFIAIGDIHGCSEQLLQILEKVKDYPEHTPIFLGDYIDRGPDSNGVINILKKMDAICLMGNHEEMLIHFLEPLHNKERSLLLERYDITEENYKWIKNLPTIFETPQYIFSHAGLHPNKTLHEQDMRDYLWTNYGGSYHHLTPKLVVQGHRRVKEPYQEGNHILIDTYCGQGGVLTGIVLPEMKIIQSDTRSRRFGIL